MNPPSDHRRAVRVLLLCTALWALSFPAMKALLLVQGGLLPAAQTWFFTALSVTLRFGLAGVILLPFVAPQLRSLRWREAEQGLVVGAFGGAGILFQMDGLAYTSASTSAFLTQGYCVFIPLWIALVHRRLPSLKIVVSVALVVAGVGVLAGVNLQSFRLGRGELETLIASLMFTGQILCLERPRYADNRPLVMTVLMFPVMALVAVPLTYVTAPSGEWWRACASPAVLGFISLITLVCTLGAYTLMNVWQRRVSATEAGLIYCVEPVLASLMSLFLPGIFSQWAGIDYPNEQITLRLLVGGGLITAANVLLQSPWLVGRPVKVSSTLEEGQGTS